MSGFINQPVRQLSLGQRMRSDIAASLLHSPEIVFFDEPTIGVDVVGKEAIRGFIRELNARDNVTMIFTTHDMQDIEKTCKRVIIIDKGNKVYDGTLHGIREKYASSRQLDVEFLTDTETVPIDGVEIVNVDARRKQFIFGKDIHINDLMSTLLNTYSVRDINISEPDIDSIIRKIYNREETA
ncbi:MAG: sugar ABC transporter ATP-binding protein, partial [Ruminiclostridium sp.]|nr:sugar ABC transporter ATP-binding protein [Ruminiclostridium sp.]